MKKFVKVLSFVMIIAMLAVTLCSCGDSTPDVKTDAVKVIDIDPKTGKISLSHKDTLPNEQE